MKLVNGDVAVGVVKNEGKYLVVKRSEENTSSGYWAFVSGEIEEDENPRDAAVREIKEETNLEVSPAKSGEAYIGEGETGRWRLHPILLKSENGDIELNWELSDYRWVELGELENLKTLGDMKAVEELDLR